MTDLRLDDAFATLARRVVPGATLLGHRRLGGGVSAEVHALEVSARGVRRSFVVRRRVAAAWKPLPEDATATEFRLLEVLHAAGLRVPEPFLLDVSGRLLPSPFLVMSRVDGATVISDASLGTALREMAAFLARLHRLDLEALDLPDLPRREDPVEGALQYLPDVPASARLREAVAAYSTASPSESLLHGDFWPGNVLWSAGELAAVVDWEDAALGPAVSDVACCRAELHAMFDAAAADTFTRHYRAASGDELRDLPLWDVYVGAAAVATMHAWGLPAEVEARRRERTSAFVARAADTLLRGG